MRCDAIRTQLDPIIRSLIFTYITYALLACIYHRASITERSDRGNVLPPSKMIDLALESYKIITTTIVVVLFIRISIPAGNTDLVFFFSV